MSDLMALTIAVMFLPSAFWIANSIDGIRNAQRDRACAAARLADALAQIARATERR